MEELDNAIRLLHESRQLRSKTIREYWQGAKTERQAERVEASMKWCERRKSQLIEIIKHL